MRRFRTFSFCGSLCGVCDLGFPSQGLNLCPAAVEARSALGTPVGPSYPLQTHRGGGLCQGVGDVEDQFKGLALYSVENEEREELSKICNRVVQVARWRLVACFGQERDCPESGRAARCPGKRGAPEPVGGAGVRVRSRGQAVTGLALAAVCPWCGGGDGSREGRGAH